MATCDLTVNVVVKRRSFAARVMRLPFVFRGHYRLMRRYGNGRLLSARAAWILAGLIVTFRKT